MDEVDGTQQIIYNGSDVASIQIVSIFAIKQRILHIVVAKVHYYKDKALILRFRLVVYYVEKLGGVDVVGH